MIEDEVAVEEEDPDGMDEMIIAARLNASKLRGSCLKGSFAWKHFEPLSSEQAKCKICGYVFKIKCGTTTSMLRHLKTEHGLEKEPEQTPLPEPSVELE